MKTFVLMALLGLTAADRRPSNTYGTPNGFTNGFGVSNVISNGFGAAPSNEYEGPASNGFGAVSSNGYAPPPSNGYAPPPSNGYAPPPSNGYGAPTTGYGQDEELALLQENIPGGGVPGQDYPVLASAPDTGFSCDDQAVPGYYADTAPEAGCQVFHICQDRALTRQKDSFLCPNGTIFNQQYLVCDWWFNVDCSLAQDFYSVNELIGVVPNGGYGDGPVNNGYGDNGNGNGRNGNGVGNGYGLNGNGRNGNGARSAYGSNGNGRNGGNNYDINGNRSGNGKVNGGTNGYGSASSLTQSYTAPAPPSNSYGTPF